jgi:putative ABC transport system permease protein
MDALARDIRHATRVLARHRTFTLIALVILALGIGANTAMFSMVYGLLLRPLPYPEADAIVRVGYGRAAEPASIGWLTNRNLPLLQQEAASLEQVAGYAPRALGWRGPDGPISLRGAMVSPSLFPLLSAAPRRCPAAAVSRRPRPRPAPATRPAEGVRGPRRRTRP